jgi:hypothetical protein
MNGLEARSKLIFTNEELQMLHRVFKRAIAVRNYREQSPEAGNVASMVLDLFERGVTDERMLLSLMRVPDNWAMRKGHIILPSQQAP